MGTIYKKKIMCRIQEKNVAYLCNSFCLDGNLVQFEDSDGNKISIVYESDVLIVVSGSYQYSDDGKIEELED